jgi:hypothetical protein
MMIDHDIIYLSYTNQDVMNTTVVRTTATFTLLILFIYLNVQCICRLDRR